jgi:tetratricopeptide (TPR) repeat protein
MKSSIPSRDSDLIDPLTDSLNHSEQPMHAFLLLCRRFPLRHLPLLIAVCLPALSGGNHLAAETSDASKRIFDRAVKLQKSGNWDLAVESWESFLQEAPDDLRSPTARLYLGVAQLRASSPRRAETTFDQLLADIAPSPSSGSDEATSSQTTEPETERMLSRSVLQREALFFAAQTERLLAEAAERPETRRKRQERAVELLTRLIDDFPKSPHHAAALYWRGRLESRLGQPLLAREDLNHALVALEDTRLAHPSLEKSPPGKVSDLGTFSEVLQQDAYRRLAFLEMEGRLESAIETWREYLERFPEAEDRGEIFWELARCLKETSRPEEALTALRKAKDLLPEEKSEDLWLMEGELLFQLGRFSEAAEVLQSGLAASEESPLQRHGKRLLAQAYSADGRPEQAEILLEQLLESDQASLATVRLLVDCLIAQGNPEEVSVHLDPRIARSEDPFELTVLQFEKARALEASPSRRKEAVMAFGQLATQSPTHPLADDALYQAIHAAMTTGRFRAALGFARRLETEYPESPFRQDALFLAGESSLQLFLMTEARRYFQLLLETYPDSRLVPLWRLRIARTWFMQKHWEKVIAILQSLPEELEGPEGLAIEIEKNYLLGCVQLALDHPEKAAASLEKAWNLADAESASVPPDRLLFQLAQAYQQMEALPTARKTLDLLLERFPESPLVDSARIQSADLQRLAGRQADAREALEALLSGDLPQKDRVAALMALAKIELVVDRPEKAIEHLDRAMKTSPQSGRKATLHYLRSVARLKRLDREASETPSLAPAKSRKLREEALADIREALAGHLEPEDQSDALLQLGECLCRLGEYQEAIAAFRTILENDPDYPYSEEVLSLLATSLLEDRRFDEALKIAADIEKRFPQSGRLGPLLLVLGETAMKREEPALAVDLLTRAEQCLPDDAEARSQAILLHGVALYRHGKYQEAARVFQRLAAQSPDSPKRWSALRMQAACALQREHFERALELLASVPEEELVPTERHHLWRDTARAAVALKEWDRVVAAMERLLEDDPDPPLAHAARFQLAQAHLEKGETDSARALFGQVFRQALPPLSLRAGLEIGYLLLANQQSAEAAEVLLRVGEGEDHGELRAEALLLAGRALDQAGQAEKARDLYRRLVNEFPDSPESEDARKLLPNDDL